MNFGTSVYNFELKYIFTPLFLNYNLNGIIEKNIKKMGLKLINNFISILVLSKKIYYNEKTQNSIVRMSSVKDIQKVINFFSFDA